MQARLRRIQRAEQQCTDLISALLLLSRNERGHGATDVGKVAEQLLDAHRAQLGGKPLVLRMEGEARPGGRRAGSGGRGGARQPDRQRGASTRRKAKSIVRLQPDGGRGGRLGPGAERRGRRALFERGYRGTHAGHSQGGGIGLSIVRRLCELYGWDVRVVPGERAGRGRDADVRATSCADPDAQLRARHPRVARGVSAEPLTRPAGSSQPYLSGVLPSNRPKNSSCMRRVTGPGLPVPTWRPSTERIGVISAAVPHMKSSSHRYRYSRGRSRSTTSMPCVARQA